MYGVCGVGDYWYATLTNHVEGDLSMTQLTSDLAMFFKRENGGDLLGLLAGYVDDLMIAGKQQFREETDTTLKTFEAKERKHDKMEFVGVSIDTRPGPPRTITLEQPVYTDVLATLLSDAAFEAFILARASIAWLAHTRPDLCCGINKLAQVTEKEFDSGAIQEYNALVKRAQAGHGYTLQ